jgi:hypothetical protein
MISGRKFAGPQKLQVACKKATDAWVPAWPAELLPPPNSDQSTAGARSADRPRLGPSSRELVRSAYGAKVAGKMPDSNTQNSLVAFLRRCGGNWTLLQPIRFDRKPFDQNILSAATVFFVSPVAFELL